jgi:2-C-methyl-D-erythritol 2,4-cyclodiphosphate synthase
MFEAFGKEATEIIKIAEEEARKLGHKLVGTEHILLAIAIREECPMAQILQKLGINAEILRADIVKLTGWGEKLDFGGSPFFDPMTKKAIENAMEEMVIDHQEYIQIEHLFLGITKRKETIASILLERRGMIAQRCREEVKRLKMEQSRITHELASYREGRPAKEARLPQKSLAELEEFKEVRGRLAHLEEQLAGLKDAVKARPLLTGIGFDSHELVRGRDLVLGGVKIPYSLGLKGHSDADVLLHAIIDAFFGAMAQGTIGTHFPDSDRRYKGIASSKLMAACSDVLHGAGYCAGNVDSIIIAEKPRLAPYTDDMKIGIATMLHMDTARVSVKPKTAEGMGMLSSGKGMAALAVVTLVKSERQK